MGRDIWSPEQYAVHAGHRQRPAYELLSRIGAQDPANVVDLGCGPGDITAELARRWPGARVTGIDSSEAMIDSAQRLTGESLRFRVGDIGSWEPDADTDVIFSNAALQWVPGHLDLLAGWVRSLAAGGWLAFGVPGNFDSPSHVLLRELCERRGLSSAIRHDAVHQPDQYLDLLASNGCAADVWETTYQQVLTGPDPVLEWTKGTALRPVLAALPDEGKQDFLAEYGKLLADAYPQRSYGTVFPFRRIFVVARRLS
jgi:trans-aconitate 2-methyltransferase